MNLAGHASDNFGHIAGFLRSVMKEIGDAVLSETSALYRRATKCRVDDARLPWVSAHGEWSSGRNFARIPPRNARLERMISLSNRIVSPRGSGIRAAAHGVHESKRLSRRAQLSAFARCVLNFATARRLRGQT